MEYLGTPRNPKLEQLISDYGKEILGISDFSDFKSEVQADLIQKDKAKFTEKYVQRMQNIIDENDSVVENTTEKVDKIRAGDLQKLLSEYNSALLTIAIPEIDIREVIDEAVKQNRTEFVYSLRTLLYAQPVNEQRKLFFDNIFETVDETFGITELLQKIETAELFSNEATGYKELLQDSQSDFEAKVLTVIAAKAQYEKGLVNENRTEEDLDPLKVKYNKAGQISLV